MRRALFALTLVLLAAAPAGAQSRQETYSEVRLALPADGQLAARLAAAGVVLDHAVPEGRTLRTVVNARELAALRGSGLAVEVLVADLAAEVAARPPFPEAERRAALRRSGIEGNIFGSMGGYPTYTEALAILDDMRAQYPGLISARLSLGRSHEGRDVWMVEVSDNPGADEGEPEVLYTAVHHAREPGGLTTVLYFLWHLLENYDSDPRVRNIINNRRLFFVPVLNPDGYVYNETTNPNGGGFWRKNRRVNAGGSRGVDLNRNYGYLWGYDNLGSSGSGWSDTYRGPSAFSEPELRALRDFLEGGRAVRAAFNYHTYGDLLLYPWGYERAYTPDHSLFVAAAERLTADNGYTHGIGPEILYPVNGDSDDWMYGEQTTKPKIFSFTPEVGPSFWPPSSQIVPLAEENLQANLLLARLADRYPLAAGAAHSGTAVAEREEGAAAFALEAAAPNPASAGTRLAFTLPVASEATLMVYDALGRHVATPVAGRLGAGRHEVFWDGRDAAGRPVASGVYVVRLDASGRVATQRLAVVR